MRMARIYTSAVIPPTLRPIGPYERRPATIRPWDPRVLDVAARVTELVTERRPDLRIEHIGSTAVAGRPGKGVVDRGAEAHTAAISAINQAM